MTNPFFSIGISAYKSDHLVETLKSVFEQSFQDFEIIIYNDCSPNNIESIVNQFSSNKIIYYKGDINVGGINLVKNWNFCLSKASGNYFFILGDDDVLDIKFLEEFHKIIIQNSEYAVFHCRSFIINEFSEIIGMTSSLPFRESVYDNIWHRIKGYRQQFISDFVYNTEMLKSKGGFFFLPAAWGSDDITSFQMMKDVGIIHINEPLLKYRINSESISYSGGYELEKIEAINLKYHWLKSFIDEIPLNENDIILRLNIISLLSDYITNQIYSELERLVVRKQIIVLTKLFFIKNEKYNIKPKSVIILILKKIFFSFKSLF